MVTALTAERIAEAIQTGAEAATAQQFLKSYVIQRSDVHRAVRSPGRPEHATLLDLKKKDQQKIENLHKQLLMQQSRVGYADFTRTKEADIADIFGPQFYVDLLNEADKDDLQAPVVLAKGTLDRFEEAFKALTRSCRCPRLAPA